MASKTSQVGVEIRKVKDVTDAIFSGGTPSTKITEYWNGGIPWLSSGETRDNFIIETEKTISQRGVENSSTRLAMRYDTIVASAGQGNTRGQVSFCLIDTYINQSIIALRAKNTVMDPRFLYYSLRSRYPELRRISDSFSSRGSLTTKLMADLEISVPPLEQQKKISDILYTLDMKILTMRKQNRILDQIIQSIFKSWFIDFEGQTEFVDSELGDIPKAWKIIAIGDAAEFVRGFSYKGSEKFQEPRGFLFVTLNSIKEGGGFKKEYAWLESNRLNKRHYINEMDLIIANTEQTKDARLLATPALVIFPFNYERNLAVYSHHITKIKPKFQNLKFYLYSFFMYKQYEIANAYHTGTGAMLAASTTY